MQILLIFKFLTHFISTLFIILTLALVKVGLPLPVDKGALHSVSQLHWTRLPRHSMLHLVAFDQHSVP